MHSYHPVGVKLDSKIIYNAKNQPIIHAVTWVLRWENLIFLTSDYYAQDLYMDLTAGTTFLDPNAEDLAIETNLPSTQIYRNQSAPGFQHRIGWASYRPAEIQANTTYTVTVRSPSTIATTDWSSLQETFGIRIPFTCLSNCIWIPITWCDETVDGTASIQLRNNQHPDGIHPLGDPQGPCYGLKPILFIPIVIR